MLVERIKNFCKNKGVSFVQFERESGLGEHSVYRWDNNSPTLKKLLQASQYFGITVSDLIGETEPASISTDGLTEAINSLTPENRELFVRLLAVAGSQPAKVRRYLSFLLQEIESEQ